VFKINLAITGSKLSHKMVSSIITVYMKEISNQVSALWSWFLSAFNMSKNISEHFGRKEDLQ